eukprot:4998723-Prymnesium_polylepis.1
MAFTVTPHEASSAAMLFVSPVIACLLDTYACRPSRPTSPMMEPTLIMRPHPFSFMPLQHSRLSTNGPTRLVRRTRSKFGVVKSGSGERTLMPALLTRMSGVLP